MAEDDLKDAVYLCPILVNFDHTNPAGAVYLKDGKLLAKFAPEVEKDVWPNLSISVGVKYQPEESGVIKNAEIHCFSASVPFTHGPNCGCHYCT